MGKEDVGDDTGRFRITVGSFVLALGLSSADVSLLPPVWPTAVHC